MKKEDSLVHEGATYDDLTQLTKDVRSLLDGRVSPGAGVVLEFAAAEDGSNTIAVYTGKAGNISSTCTLDDEYRADVAVEMGNIWKILQLETEPPIVLLSDMWEFFARNEYLSAENLTKVRAAESSGEEVLLTPVPLWRGSEGKLVLKALIPSQPVKQALECVFLAHVWNYLRSIGAPVKASTNPVRTLDANRVAITGLAQITPCVGACDGKTVGELHRDVVTIMRKRGMTMSDWRINDELGF